MKYEKIQEITKKAKNNGTYQEFKLSQTENMLYQQIQQQKASSDNNRILIDGIQASINNLSQQMQVYDHKMEQYDITDIQPRFDQIENKQSVLIDLLIYILDSLDVELTEEQLNVLGLKLGDNMEVTND